MANRILNKVETALEIQLTPGGSNRAILDVSNGIKHALGDITVSHGAITRKYRLDPSSNAPVPRPVQRDSPEPITAEVSAIMSAYNYLEGLNKDSRFTLYVRYPPSSELTAHPLSYDRVDILTDCALESMTIPAPVVGEPSTDDTVITFPVNAATHLRINPVTGSRIETGVSDANDCNAVAIARDPATGWLYAVTVNDGVGAKPFLYISEDDFATFTSIELTDLAASCTAIAVAGDYLIIASGTEIGVHNKTTGAQVATTTAAQAISKLAAIDAANIVAIGAAGYIALSEDGGLTWTVITSGVATALNSVTIRNINEWFIGGASGVLLKYNNGTITALSSNLPGALAAATIGTIALPDSPSGFDRDETIYIGASTGNAYKSDDDGVTWVQYEYPGDGAGAVTQLAFAGFMGQVLYILHTNAGGDSVLKRDWSGGVGGTNNVESVAVPTNTATGLNEMVIDPDDVNTVYIVGDVYVADDMFVKVSRS